MATADDNKLPVLWIILGVVAAVGIGWIVFDAAADKGVALTYQILLPFILLGWLWVLWRLQPNLPRRLDSAAEWKKPKAAASVLFVALSSISGLGGIVQLVSPRAATETTGGKIENTTDATLVNTNTIIATLATDRSNVARQKIPGLWGEDERCRVTYRFAIDGKTLSIKSEKRPPDTRPNQVEGDIMPDDPKRPDVLRMLAIGGDNGTDPRAVAAATFTYEVHGQREELLWADAAGHRPVPYVRCGQ